jgi:hypothetical protein
LVGLLLALACLTSAAPGGAGDPPVGQFTTADPFLTIMAEPWAAAIVMRHAPHYVRLLDQQVTPPPSAELTLDDLLDIPAAEVTPQDIAEINAALAALPARRPETVYPDCSSFQFPEGAVQQP